MGTGDGVFVQSWVQQCGSADLTLLDPSAAMLAQAKAQFAARGVFPRIVMARLEGFQHALRFDVILAAHVLEHFDNPADACCQMARLLAPGGRLFLVVSKPHLCNWLIWLRFRHRWFGKDSACKMARHAGLTHHLTHVAKTGTPSRTSLGYIFTQEEGMQDAHRTCRI